MVTPTETQILALLERDDERAALVLVEIAKRLSSDSGATKIVLSREQATVLVCWLARALFGEPSEFLKELRNAGIL